MNTPPASRADADAAAPTPATGSVSGPESVSASGPVAVSGAVSVSVSAEDALAAVGEIIDSVGGGLDLRAQSGDDLLATAAQIERVGRWVDAMRVAAAAQIADQSRPELGSDGLAAQRGCRTANELLQRVTRISGATAARRLTLGSATRSTATLAGYQAPPRFPAVADAMTANVLGVDSAFAVVTGLTPVLGCSADTLWTGAEQELVAAATGIAPGAVDTGDLAADPDAGTAPAGSPVACTPEETKLQAAVWRAVLDPDGVEPAEERAMRKRGFRIGRERDGVVPVSGQLVPVAAAMLTKVFTACMSPRTAPTFLSAEETAAATAAAGEVSDLRTRDPRSPDQQRHDILVGVIENATRSADTPTVGGAPPTVLVTIRERDLRTSSAPAPSAGHHTPANATLTCGRDASANRTSTCGRDASADQTTTSGREAPADRTSTSGPTTPADPRPGFLPVGPDLPADARAATPSAGPDIPTDTREATPPVAPDLSTVAREAPHLVGHPGAAESGFVPARAGVGFVEGVQSAVSVATVRQFICAGGIQTVTLNDAGRVVSLGSEQRCFTGQQRRAITVRDGGCLIPGCGIPASWCEIHHVAEAARGGPTHTDNGALLCWFHHRTIDTSGWQIRIRHGVPQVKAPNWIQLNAPWRPVTRSPTRLHDALDP